MSKIAALEAFLAKNMPKAKKWLKQPAPGNVLTKGGAIGAGGLAGLAAYMASGNEEQMPQPQQPYDDSGEEDYQVILRKLSKMQEYE